MSDIEINAVCKSFDGRKVLSDVTLSIRSGEFVAILGPSGCGKTTLLRLVAGFESPDRGTIALGGTTVAGVGREVPPEARDLGIVFQSYALWPHMTVAGNVGYRMKVAGVPVAERERRVAEALETVGLAGLGDRRPAALSGGQRQRVALARCLAARPSAVLLDEPLANLDVHLRASMEEEFARFHRATGATMFYITHDQAEAMALADRVAVMDRGRLMQFAAPAELYRCPANPMVAGFIGEGYVIEAEGFAPTGPERGEANLLGQRVPVRCARGTGARRNAWISLHPESLRPASDAEPGLSLRVLRTTYRGAFTRVEAAPDGHPARFSLNLPQHHPVRAGDSIRVTLDDGWVLPEAA